MIRDLYVNEKLIVSFNNNKLNGVLKREFIEKDLTSEQVKFIKDYPDVMKKIKEGKELLVTTNGVVTISSIEDKEGKGFSIPSSIGDLDDKISGRRK